MKSQPSPDGFAPEVYKNFLMHSENLFYVCDFSGALKEVNPAWKTHLGYEPSAVIGRPFFDFIHPEDAPHARKEFQSSHNSASQKLLMHRFRFADGTYRWFKWSIWVDSEKQLVFATSTDITAAEIYSRSLTEVFTQAPCLASITEGPQHIYRFVNEAYKQFMGNRELLGKSVVEAVPDVAPEALELLDRVYRTGERFVARDHKFTADWLANGQVTEKFFSFIYSPILNSYGVATGIWCLAFDVTAQKQLENVVQITERVSAIGKMAAGVAHEINNPLTYLIGNLGLLRKKVAASTSESASVKAELEKLLQKSEDGALRIKEIVKLMNQLSNTNSSQLEAVSIQEVLSTTLEYAKNEECKNAEFILNVESGLEVLASKGGLIQVFLNLVVNACHAIRSGNKENNFVKVTAAFEKDGLIAVKVTDTGHGIPKQNLEHIFDPFFTSKPSGEGTGLGLSISYSIVQSYGGTITLTSELGKGTEFTVRLPAHTPEKTPV